MGHKPTNSNNSTMRLLSLSLVLLATFVSADKQARKAARQERKEARQEARQAAKAANGVQPEQEDPCSIFPCFNGGSCIGNDMRTSYQCICPEGLKGSHCESTIG